MTQLKGTSSPGHYRRVAYGLLVVALSVLPALSAPAQASLPPAWASAPDGGANMLTTFWACVYRDINPPNWEYVRYIEAASKGEAEAKMRVELPDHQMLIGCNPTGL
ncbi:hypothetical protein ABRP17_005900 [Stenotrophomonas sp. WHRI 8082]|uniref:hypothetical protein n=1 Tax=Stenotrophomonas sp. WHRI 8082 TaxID=3162571 RepID=UPI0035586535